MVSDFLVAHPSGPFFVLNDQEWELAIKKYPNLIENDGLNYKEKTSTASIIPGQEGYFSNEHILNQTERLCQMLEFSQIIREPPRKNIVLVFDNARTHTALEVNLNDFGLKPGTNCPLETLNWVTNNGESKKIDLYFPKNHLDRNLAGKSKGLKIIASELGLIFDKKAKLENYREELSKHPAFYKITKLEKLGLKYNVKVIFNPKYHCELNPIEGLWCSLKYYVRKHSNQSFDDMKKLITEARNDFKEKKIYIKLLKRFWNCLEAYANGASYGTILWTYFSGKSKEKIESHRKIYEPSS